MKLYEVILSIIFTILHMDNDNSSNARITNAIVRRLASLYNSQFLTQHLIYSLVVIALAVNAVRLLNGSMSNSLFDVC